MAGKGESFLFSTKENRVESDTTAKKELCIHLETRGSTVDKVNEYKKD